MSAHRGARTRPEFWGYAVVDEQGRPVSRFHESLRLLVELEPELLPPRETCQVCSYMDGQWQPLPESSKRHLGALLRKSGLQ